MIFKRIIFLPTKNRIIKRQFYDYIENSDNLDYSFVPIAYVITLSSILWGFESNNNLNKNKFFFDNFVHNIFINCLKNNDKSECLQLKKYLSNEINQIENKNFFSIKFKNFEKNKKPNNNNNLFPITDINED
tara:strand:+ start:84 stop:479 length:396 start_codon:yes stop_codon:yes gene_type:complete